MDIGEPFGTVQEDRDPDRNGVLTYNFLRLPGQIGDTENGLDYNYFRTYDPLTGRYLQSDPIGLKGGVNTFGYVGGNPVANFDASGLASSGQSVKLPGGKTTTVRIDNPHVPNQQVHAHVCEKGCDEVVVNKDGTGSHGTDPSKLKSKVKSFLRGNGFNLATCLPDLMTNEAKEGCASGDQQLCNLYAIIRDSSEF